MLLKVTDLEVFYGNIQAVSGVSFEMDESEILSIIGSNGVGKTTVLQTIMGLNAPKRGKILLSTKGEIQGLPPHKIVRMGVTYIPEGEADSDTFNRERKSHDGCLWDKGQGSDPIRD